MKITVKEVTLANQQKTIQRILGDGVKVYANTRLHAYCSPYVPMDTGYLDQTVDITKDYVHYKAPYAHKMWDGDGLNFSKDKHPLATSHWERAMAVSKGKQLAKDIEDHIKKG